MEDDAAAAAAAAAENGDCGRLLALSQLDANLTCSLCRGYFIDATTITECMHTCTPPL